MLLRCLEGNTCTVYTIAFSQRFESSMGEIAQQSSQNGWRKLSLRFEASALIGGHIHVDLRNGVRELTVIGDFACLRFT